MVVVFGVYDLRCYRNMAAPEAMDAAQLARNISRGRGYTTQFIRPLSIYLTQQKSGGAEAFSAGTKDVGGADVAAAYGSYVLVTKQPYEQVAHRNGPKQVSNRHNYKTRKEHDQTEFSR